MTITNYPITFNRDFGNDFSANPDAFIERCQSCCVAALSVLSLCRPLRAPLSLVFSGIRTISNASDMLDHVKAGNYTEALFHLVQICLAVAAIGLFFFNVVFCLIASSISDLIIHIRLCIECLMRGDYLGALEALAFITLDLLFLASICYGSIWLTVACMGLQILLDFYLSGQHIAEGRWFEGACQAIMMAGHVGQAIPQFRLAHWAAKNGSTFRAELKQNDQGFVYLDVPDEKLFSLNKLYKDLGMELPPYFGSGRAGAHISVMSKDELPNGMRLRSEDIGKVYTCHITHMDAVQNQGSKGSQKVYFLGTRCSKLESLRKNYGLTPRIEDHDFHLTFGIQYRSTGRV